MAVPEFSFSSKEVEWFTDPSVIRFAELLMGKVDVDLCGLSPHWSGDTVSHGGAESGLNTFLNTQGLVGKSVFANPPYGWLLSQYVLAPDSTTPLDLKYLPAALKYDHQTRELSAPVPKRYEDDVEIQLGGYATIWDMNKATGQMEHTPIMSRVHSAHCFAHYLLRLWQDGIIKQAFILIPSATDSKGHALMFEGSKYVINTTQRLTFWSPNNQGNLVKRQGNTKGSSLFWLPPHQMIRCEQDYVRKLKAVETAMGGDVGFKYHLTKHIC